MLNIPCRAGIQSVEDTGFGYTLSLIGGKYKMVVMFWLNRNTTLRFNEMKRRIGSISYKTLASTLKEMERDGLVVRTEYPQVPPKVEYALSGRGRSLIPILGAMCDWGNAHRPSDDACR